MQEKLLVNRYKIIEKLGEGGMGLIWRVIDEIEKKEVALKEIKTDEEEKTAIRSFSENMLGVSLLGKRINKGEDKLSLLSPLTTPSDAEMRFSEEFRTMTKLQYPYTVKVFDYGILENGNRYITMEIVEGESLKILLKKKKFEFQEIYKILIQLAQTLNFIHTRLYVHRDIKSENIIITKEGDIKLLDFGLMDRLGQISDGKVTGTIQYLPPEVIKGGIINESSDLYSLGILAYEITVGQLPFNGKEIMDIIKMHINLFPRPLTDIRSDAPNKLEKIIFKLIEKEQGNRYQKAPELIEDLSQLSYEKSATETLEQKKSYLFCCKLIGREHESIQLKEAFQKMKKGQGQSVFIAASAGVGKSRVIKEFKLEVQLAEILFLEGFCFDQGMSSYQIFKEALKQLIPFTQKEILNKYGSVLVKIIPELNEKGFEPATTLDEFSEKVRINQAVVEWLKDISVKTPFVICFEDLHWSDLSSLDLLNNCIRDLKNYPIMFLGTFRDDEVDDVSPLFFSVEENLTQLLRLCLFNKDNMIQLIEGMLGKIEFVNEFYNYIYVVTGGNPFFIIETLRFLIEEEKIRLQYGNWYLPSEISQLVVPKSIHETVSYRLRLLSHGALQLAQIASVMGKELDLSILSNIINFSQDDFFKFLDELLERQFIKKEEKNYFFTHDTVWETLYKELAEEEKRKLHEQVGNILERKNSKNTELIASLLAYHYTKGEDKQKAVKYLLMAGDISIKKAVYIDLIENYVKALSILETIEYPDKEKILFEARNKLINFSYLFRHEVAINEYFKFIPKLYELGGGEQKVRKIAKLFQYVYKIINLFPIKISKKIKKALTKQYPPYQMPKKNDYAHILAILSETTVYYGNALFIQGEYSKQLNVVNDVIENFLPETTGSLDYASVLMARAGAYFGSGKHGKVKKDMKESIKVFEENFSLLNEKQKYLTNIAWYWHNQSCSDTGFLSDDDFQKQLQLATKYNFYDAICYAYMANLSSKTWTGKYPEAIKIGQALMDWCKKLGYPRVPHFWYYGFMTYVYLERGDFKLAEKCLDKTKKLQHTSNGVDFYWNKYCQARLHIYQHELEKGCNLLEECVSELKKNDFDGLSRCSIELAYCYLKKGKTDKALTLLEMIKARALSEDSWHSLNQINVYRALGRLNLQRKMYEIAINYFTKCIKLCQETDNKIQEGLALTNLAEAYIELTQYNLARDFLEKASQKFKEIENEYQLSKVQDLEKRLNKFL